MFPSVPVWNENGSPLFRKTVAGSVATSRLHKGEPMFQLVYPVGQSIDCPMTNCPKENIENPHAFDSSEKLERKTPCPK